LRAPRQDADGARNDASLKNPDAWESVAPGRARRNVVHGEYKVPGGKLVVVDLEVRDGRLAGVRVSGDFFLEPDTALAWINQALEAMPANAGEAAYTTAIAGALEGAQAYGLSAEGVAIAVGRALQAQVDV